MDGVAALVEDGGKFCWKWWIKGAMGLGGDEWKGRERSMFWDEFFVGFLLL